MVLTLRYQTAPTRGYGTDTAVPGRGRDRWARRRMNRLSIVPRPDRCGVCCYGVAALSHYALPTRCAVLPKGTWCYASATRAVRYGCRVCAVESAAVSCYVCAMQCPAVSTPLPLRRSDVKKQHVLVRHVPHCRSLCPLDVPY
eukprot:275227-Rhodomonas_salina.2